MRIGMIGAGATGKSTTMELLKDLNLKRSPSFVKEVLRNLKIKEDDLKNMSLEERWKLQKALFDAKLNRDLLDINSQENTITDRTLLDHLIYCYYYAGDAISDEVARSMEILVQENMERYDLLFFFPTGLFSPSSDEIRKRGYVYRETINFMMIGFMKTRSIWHFIVPSGSVDERAQWVKNTILTKYPELD